MATWRKMSLGDVEGLLRVAEEVHPDLPESESVFAERAKLFPEGCLVLAEEEGGGGGGGSGSSGGEVCGYAISHPIRRRQPPALDSLLGEIAPDADQYYIHDVAVLPRLRGRGLAAVCVSKLLEVAERERGYPTTCLVSVYGTLPFWGRFGFVPERADAVLAEKLRGYGQDATYMTRQNGRSDTNS